MLIRSALALVLAASSALAAPPTDEQIDALIKTITDNRAKLMEVSTKMREAQAAPKDGSTEAAKPDTKDLQEQIKDLNAANKKAVEELSLEEATLPQIEKIVTARVSTPDMNKAFAKPLTDLSKAQTVDGARACELRIQFYPAAASAKQEDRDAREADLAKLYAEALKHPALPELLKSGKGDVLVRQIATFKPETIKSNDLMTGFEKALASDMSVAAAGALAGTVEKVRDASDTGDRDRILDKIATCAEKSVKNAPADAVPASVKRASDTAKLARSGWARGTMIGNTAPDISFQWTNASFTKLSDLKGKVVILDFWATWCGPCIASFPKIRELQARYKDYPVVILGVTSLQGYHIDQTDKKRPRIDCKDDPKKEMELMPGFIKGMDMTWSVAFSDDGCFNPNYGVRGIPHLAIIAPDGKVRFNELRPKDPAEDAEKIDALLKEFKLNCPAEPMTKAEKPAASAGS
jgi:thiol-disulfide isomerase/thioredoxin